MDVQMHKLIAKLKREQPRNADLHDLCSRAERAERAALALAKLSTTTDEPLSEKLIEQVADAALGGPIECPVCAARRQAEKAKKQKQRKGKSK